MIKRSWLLGFAIIWSLLTDERASAFDYVTDAVREIALADVFTTSPQKGMLHERDVFPRTDKSRESRINAETLRMLHESAKTGASNVFLVDAPSVRDAVRASFRILVGSRAARTPATLNQPNPPRGNYWVVGYLGAGPSDPTWWTVNNIVISGNRVRLSYRESPPRGATRDINPYYYWAPVGSLPAGNYQLELYDAGRDLVTLMRNVEVETVK